MSTEKPACFYPPASLLKKIAHRRQGITRSVVRDSSCAKEKGRQWRPLKLIPRRKSGNYRHRHDRGFLCAVIHHNEKQPVSQHERPAMRFNSSSCLSVVSPRFGNHRRGNPAVDLVAGVRHIPGGVWFLRPLPTSDHRLHLSLDDKNSRAP